MPTQTYTPLAHVTLAATAASITFGSIPNTYRDLVLVVHGISTSANYARINLNGAPTTFSYVNIKGSGSAATSETNVTNNNRLSTLSAGSTFVAALQITASIMDYSTTDKHKTILSRAGQPATGTELVVTRWANTSAVTSLSVVANGDTWGIGTTAVLYGVVA